MLAYSRPTRTVSNEVVLHLTPDQRAAPPVPFELKGQISTDKWEMRIDAIMSIAGRYSKPMVERVWLIVGFMSAFVLSMLLYQFVLSKLLVQGHESERSERQTQAAAISFGIFVGLDLLVVAPMLIWKCMGSRAIAAVLQKWGQVDHAQFGQHACLWKASAPGVFRIALMLTITLPPAPAPTAFHPDAYLPSYINGPHDDGAYFYPYRRAEPGLPHMSVIGNVPIHIHEKSRFEEVRI
ncbi:hypothetical protein EV421DRAFT_1896598 [Armillaria borealis]|uniref:Uncharacterized protein n=1 Tax=Armillaria borealis TaxID=47425 RepID=A0AA39K512_9AGAR|nr:hypothetical protein EV421DRAFT_1896598 [Armillaria borealis]